MLKLSFKEQEVSPILEGRKHFSKHFAESGCQLASLTKFDYAFWKLWPNRTIVLLQGLGCYQSANNHASQQQPTLTRCYTAHMSIKK